MNCLLEYIAGIFTAPRATLKQIASSRPLVAAIAVFILTSLISGTASLSSIPAEMPFGVGMFLPALVLGSLIFGTLGWFLQTGIYHLFAEFLGGKGRAVALFTTLPFTTLPGIILAPIGLLIRSTSVPYFSTIVSLALLIWIFLLQVWALEAVYNLSRLRAAAVILLPIAIFIAAVFIFGLTLLTTLIPIIMQTMPQFPLAF